MNFITQSIGQSLFERVVEIVENLNLTPLERIPKFRAVLEGLFKELTKDENQFFSNQNARESYHFLTYTNTPKQLQRDIKSLRIFSNKVVHETDIKPEAKDEQVCLKTISEAVAYFSKAEIPDQLKMLTQNVQATFRQTQYKKQETISVTAIVEDIYIPQGESQQKYCVLKCEAEDLGLISLLFWNNRENGFGSDLTEVAQLVWKFATIYVTDIRQDNEDKQKYHTTIKTLVVLEPDYLIDVKEIAECFQINGSNPLVFLLNKFSKVEPSQPMILGNIAGAILDDSSTQTDFQFQSTFTRAKKDNALSLLHLANQNGGYDEGVVNNIELSAQTQQTTIAFAKNQFLNKKINIEPTFISNKFGIQGRLDVLYEDTTDSNVKNILELKSGSFPNLKINMWQNHLMQTILYDLLIKSVFPNRIGNSYILYSKAKTEEQPLRTYPGAEWTIQQQQALMLRNKIVANEYNIARGNISSLLKINSLQFGAAPTFSIGEIKEFGNTVANLNELEKQYFFGFAKFIAKELQTAKIGSNELNDTNGGFASIWKKSKAEKKDDYNVLDCLKIESISDDFKITLKPDHDLFSNKISDFREGDIAILYPVKNPDYLNPLESQILKCTVVSLSETEVVVNLINKQLDQTYFDQAVHWAIEHDFREAGYKSLFRSLYNFIKTDRERKNLIFGLTQPTFNQISTTQERNLLPEQNTIVNSALAVKNYFLIQGPPGTGKTSTILKELVRKLKEQNENVVVLAFTNRAVDEICSKISELNIDFIRLGKNYNGNFSWRNLTDNLTLDLIHDKIQSTNIFISTQASFANSLELLKLKKFKTLLVDEASQLLEPQLNGIISEFERFILIGDAKQLPAVVVQDETSSKCSNKTLNDIGLLNFRDSLFSRLLKNAQQKKWTNCYGVLTNQYRMHKDIAEFVNKEFYGGILQEVNPEQKDKIQKFSFQSSDIYEKALSISRVIYVPTKKEPNKSKLNDHEAKLVAEFVKTIKKIYGNEFDINKTVGVITPYRAQIANIKEQLPSELKKITVDTVERFQGSEREIIIISLAVKNENQLQFLQSIYDNVDRKLNVALTRAKRHLVILGCEEVLKKNEVYRKLIDYIKNKNGYCKF